MSYVAGPWAQAIATTIRGTIARRERVAILNIGYSLGNASAKSNLLHADTLLAVLILQAGRWSSFSHFMPKSATHSHKDISLAEVANLVPVASYLDVGGSPVQHQLSALRISPELVERGDGKITKVQLYGFLNRCRSQVGLPDLGYRAGVGFGPEQLSTFGKS